MIDVALSDAPAFTAILGGNAVYSIGDLVNLTVVFTGPSGPVNPTTVTVTVRDPTGAVTTITPTLAATGTYIAQVTATVAGEWRWRAQGTGAVQAAGQASFYVQPNSF
jgi:hypothetical protein